MKELMPAIRMMAENSEETDSASRPNSEVVESASPSSKPPDLSHQSSSNGARCPGETELVNKVIKNEPGNNELKTQTGTYNEDIDNADATEYVEEAESEGIITKVMVIEEEKGQKESDVKVERLRQQYENETHNKEMEEKKFQRLQGLLQRSQFYSNFALKKLDQLKTTHDRKLKSEVTLKPEKRPAINDTKTCQKPRKSRKSASSYEVKAKIEDLSDKADSSKGDLLNGLSSSKSRGTCGTRVTCLGLTVPASQPQLLIGGALRDYQLEGLNWLKMLFLGGMNGILADEMGLGKTIQIISLLCHLYEEKVEGPFLIVAPLSTLPNWIQEFQTFAPDIPVILYHGDKARRKQLVTDINKYYKLLGISVKPVVVTSYQIPLMETACLRAIRWKYIIVDEGHRLKNHNTLLARCLSGFKSINRMILTGTPLQNNLYELWSLLHFLMPEIFDDLDDFHAWFSTEEVYQHQTNDAILAKEKTKHFISTLHKILEPFLLRRVKSDVNLNLPPKEERHIHCPISDMQYQLYSQTLDRTIVLLDEKYKLHNTEPQNLIIPDNPDGSRPKRKCSQKFDFDNPNKYTLETDSDNISTELDNNNDEYVTSYDIYRIRLTMASIHAMLRKIANHPYLVKKLVIPGTTFLQVDERLITNSGKMIVLDSLLLRLKQDNHKVLIFSTFTMILDLIEPLMEMRKHSYVRLDGQTSLEDRKFFINMFNTDADIFAFLISTRAGGLGINLTAADTVIIFDSDWNPQVDLQAQDRCHRIGQTKPVIVFRLISSGTIDERIVTRAEAKRKLEKVIIKAGLFNKSIISQKSKLQVSIEDLKGLLEEKNHTLEIHSNGSVLTDEEWKKLLDRSF